MVLRLTSALVALKLKNIIATGNSDDRRAILKNELCFYNNYFVFIK